MGIFRRISLMLRGKVNDTLDAAENPVSSARQYIRDLENQIREAEGALLLLKGNQKAVASKLQDSQHLLAKRRNQASVLETKETVDDALKAEVSEDITRLLSDVSDMQAQVNEIEKVIGDVGQQLDQVKKLKNNAHQKLNKMLLKQNMGRALSQASDVLTQFDTNNLQSEFSRFVQKTDDLYNHGLAKMEHVQFQKEKTLDARLDQVLSK